MKIAEQFTHMGIKSIIIQRGSHIMSSLDPEISFPCPGTFTVKRALGICYNPFILKIAQMWSFWQFIYYLQ
ncbi:hypothetical protein [Paenibacillus sp. FSL R10-2791]|uniref:hypothetical protein n=1 Tax=Paenibacillus sp. FSL R10-2791 TaxID=2954695 RepID=UPI004047E19D